MARRSEPGRETGLAEKIPELVLRLGRRVEDAGGELYIVGGWVRDELMDRESREADLATSLPPPEMKRLMEGLGSIYDIGERFGTVALRAGDELLEVTTFRAEEYRPGSRHPEVSLVEDLERDLARRDFTVNAMALSVAPRPGLLYDLYGGREDIERGLIRTPGDPGPRMAEDPLRMMRAVRLAAELGFDIEPGLLAVIEERAGELDTISMERRRDELERILVSPGPAFGIRTLVDTGLMEYVCGEISAMRGVDQPLTYHRADVLGHTLLTVEHLPPDALLRRAALFHDVGKPPAKVTEPKVMFPQHDKISEEITRECMSRLRYGVEETRKTSFLVRVHMRPIHYEREWSDAAVRRLIRDCTLLKNDEVLVPLERVLELARADIKAGNEDRSPVFLALVADLEKRIAELRAQQDVARVTSPLDGRELMETFGRGPGPWIGAVKDHLVHLVLEGELPPGDTDAAARRAAEFLERKGP